jgi:hypothetical protein
MNYSHINPITLHISQPFVYSLNSLINRIVEKDQQFFDHHKSHEAAIDFIQTVVGPTLEFLHKNDIKANIIIPGKLVEYIGLNKKVKNKIREMINDGTIKLVVDAYYGESLVSLFNSSLWVDSLTNTLTSIENILGVHPEIIFVPQLFRTLELEKITELLGITQFVTRKKSKKPDMFSMQLSDFRRFDGGDVSWISEEKDALCHFYTVPNNLFYDLNLALFEKDIFRSTNALNMEMGLNYSQYLLKSTKKTLLKNNVSIRIEEKYSLYLYNHIQRAVIRLWRHASMVLASSDEDEKETHNNLYSALSKLQSSSFLNYLEKRYYVGQKVVNFSSPYEAFVNMQSAIKEIEILVRNKI